MNYQRSNAGFLAGAIALAVIFTFQSASAFTTNDFGGVTRPSSRTQVKGTATQASGDVSSSSSSSVPFSPILMEPASSSSTASSLSPAQQQVLCLAQAMGKREYMINAIFDAYYKYIKDALSKRDMALGSSMDEPDEARRRELLASAWKEFGFTWRTAGVHMRELRRNVWTQYREDRLACGVLDKDDPEGGGYGMDSQF
jgi:hypothetical protein